VGEAGCRQFDPQRQTVETMTDARYRHGILRRQREPTARGRTLDKEADRVMFGDLLERW
jgi:hypothetical protein